MAKMTLLQIVQNVLSSMEADNVNSIGDTVESAAIARTAEETYYELMAYGDWPHLVGTYSLTSLSDSAKPNYLEIPDEYKNIQYLSYLGTELRYKEPEEFLKYVNSRDLSLSNVVEVTGFHGVTYKIINDTLPTYFTLLEEKYVVTDSYDSVVETTLQGDNASVVASVLPAWASTDNYVPSLTDNMFPVYLAMVKRAAFLYFRREVSNKDERVAIAGLGRLRRDLSKLYRKDKVINYGR